MSIQSPLDRGVGRMVPKTLVFLALFIVQVSCQYKNSLTFVIDDTGSMSEELKKVKEAAKFIVDIVLNETSSQIEDIVLVTFNDPGVKFWSRTRDVDVFKHALDQVHLHNGGCSEMSLTGIKLALEESLPGSFLFVFTDAGSNDLHLLQKVISLCQEKQSQVVFVLTGHICQTTAEYYMIARASNGQVFEITREQIDQVIEYVKENIKGDRSVITNQVVPPRRLTNVKFYIDDKTEYAIVSASGERVSLKIKDNFNRDLISGYSQIMWTENVKVLKLEHLITGAYVAQVYGSTNVNVMVFARTDFTFEYGFSNKQEHSLSTTETQPTIGTPTYLTISVRDEKNSVTVQEVQILDMDENVVATLPLTDMGGKVYATGRFVPPNRTFKVAVIAMGRSTRRPLRRIAKTPVAPIRPVTVAPEIIDSAPYLKNREGSTVDLQCRIRKGKPKPSITWFFMKKGTSDYVQMRDTNNEVLRLTNVLMDNDGHYKCVAENTVGRAEHIVQLEVEVAPMIDDLETYLRRREGSTVDIGCRIQKGNPTPNIRWFFMKKGTGDYVQMRDTNNEVLRLTNVLMDNDGHYKCVAENTVGRAEHIVQLEVEVAPMIDDLETYLRRREGSTVDIGCRIQKGNPAPNIRWFFMKKGTGDYVQMRDTNNEVLRLTNVLMDNDGHYKCVAENTVGRAEHIVQLEVEVAPMIDDLETYLRRREGSSVDIGCRIQKGNPTPNIRWFFMKKGTGDYVQMRDTNNEVLRLTNVLMDNDGHYKCVAENTVGRAEHIVQLEVEVAPIIDDLETYLRRREGSTVDIGCRIQKGNPTPNIRWFFMKKGTGDYVQMRDTNNEVLRLTNVLMDNDGHYKCVAENTVGRAEHIVQLEVEVAPMIDDLETYLRRREGSTVDIGCRIQKGNPTPNIRWFFMKKGTGDYVQMRDTNNEVLRLTNVLMDNDGHYKCVAENTVGRAEHIVQLEVEVAPMIDDLETYLRRREGSTVDIGCRIQKGNPAPNIRWFFMKKGTGDYVQMRDTNNEVLRLTNVLMHNDGHYKCVAENTVGRAEHIVQLEVEVAPMIDDLETYLRRREGSTVDIGCRIQKGNPTPNIRWFFMKKGTGDYVQMRDTNNEVLRLTNVLMDNDGNYKCVAENTVGRAEHIVLLEVEVAPKISDSEKYVKKTQGDLVDIHCRILQGNPQPQITWFFRKQGARAFEQLTNKTEQVLHLTNIVMDYAGDYKCVAENVVNRAEHVVQLEVEVPPGISSPPNEFKYRGVEGDVAMKLSCIAEGHPKPIISWTIDSITIDTDKSNQSYVEDGSLFVKNPVSANSNNTYVCVATNAVGEHRQIYEVLISEFEDYNQTEKMYGEVGKPYEINCSLPFTDPNSVRWYYNSVYLNVTGASIRWENASEVNDGNYTCRVSDLSGAASVTVELIFGHPPSPSSRRTEFEEEWEDTLVVVCKADLNMIGTYEWYRNGERIKDAKGTELNVHQFGGGNYTCRATNPLGSLNITYKIPSQDCLIDKNLWTTKKMPVIIDNTPAWPTFSNNQKFVVVPQSEKLHLICQDDPPMGEFLQPHSLNNSFTKFPSIKSIEAICDHEDTFLVDGVSQKISELDCILSVTPSVHSGKQCLGENTQMIDVGFYVDDFIKVYSSCLDTNRNLSLYTTVTMQGSDIPWEAKEPERPCKQVADCCYETVELVSAEDVGFGAAEWATLKEPRNSVFYCRPNEDAFTIPTSTTESRSEAAQFSPRPSADNTETTTAEQPPDPETSWHDIQRVVRDGYRTTVWSGAGNYTRVGNMMVPQYLWKVVKNLDDDMIVAIVHSNARAPIPKLCATDCLSSSVLALFEPQGLRTYCCSLDEFKTAFNVPIPF